MERIWLKQYPAGVPADIDPTQYSSLVELLEESFAKFRDRKAFICMDKAISYRELDEMSLALGAWLQSRGLKKGARVALMMPNVLQYPIALFGTLRAGCTVVNVNPLYTARELEHQLNDAGADAMGGFSAAAASLGAAPVLYSLDTSRPEAPRVRTAREDVARLIRGRLAHPRWIAAQLRHGWRGVQELAQGLDAVFVMAAATDAVPDAEIDRLYDAYLGDAEVLAAIEAANPGVAQALRDRFADLRDRVLWRSRRNSLAALESREAAE